MRKPKTLRRIRYTVKGYYAFPTDMLRYDSSHPATPEDQQWIELASRSRAWPIELMLEMFLVPWEKDHGPTEGRWNSFGWKVTEVYPMERVPFESIPQERLPLCYRMAR